MNSLAVKLPSDWETSSLWHDYVLSNSRGEHEEADRESVVTNGAESFLTTTTSDTDAWEWDNDIGLANATDELEVGVSIDDWKYH